MNLASALVYLGAGALMGLLQGSFFEWVYHRYWLHRPWLPPQMFTAHTLVHHQLCKHDDTFHVHDEEQEEALTFQWWGGPVLITLNLLPWLGVWALLRNVVTTPQAIAYLGGFYASMFSYYLAYEGFHYLMHKPSIAWIERSAPFRFIENHHRIHHAHMGRNFNVVLPLADFCLGTLMLRDPLRPRRTEPSARQIARRHSKFGQQMAEGAATGHVEKPAVAPVGVELEESVPR